jgi:L-rhamnose-H+ transport protein
VLLGVATALLGIAIVGKAGHTKEFEQAALLEMASGGCSDLPRAADFRKGVGVAVFSGIMSSCFAYGLAAGEPLRQLTLAHGTPALAQGLPVLVVVLLGGFTTNAVWCLILILKNRSGRELVGELKVAGADLVPSTGRNYLLCALAGTAWYFQFFFYTMGESQMGRYKFSSWTLHMASIIIFSSLWGIGFNEWKGAGSRARQLLAVALFLLVASTVIVGYGNYLGLGHAAP